MGKLIFTKKCYLLEDIDFYEKWPPEPIKRLVILGISDIGGNIFLCEQVDFQVGNTYFQRKSDI